METERLAELTKWQVQSIMNIAISHFPKLITPLSKELVFWNDLSVILSRDRGWKRWFLWVTLVNQELKNLVFSRGFRELAPTSWGSCSYCQWLGGRVACLYSLLHHPHQSLPADILAPCQGVLGCVVVAGHALAALLSRTKELAAFLSMVLCSCKLQEAFSVTLIAILADLLMGCPPVPPHTSSPTSKENNNDRKKTKNTLSVRYCAAIACLQHWGAAKRCHALSGEVPLPIPLVLSLCDSSGHIYAHGKSCQGSGKLVWLVWLESTASAMAATVRHIFFF